MMQLLKERICSLYREHILSFKSSPYEDRKKGTFKGYYIRKAPKLNNSNVF